MQNADRRVIVAGNWKMNMLPSDVDPYFEELGALLPEKRACECVLCIPSVLLYMAKPHFDRCGVALGAQNVNENIFGAYTGEVSAPQLRELGAKYVIVGHSERRQYYGESNPAINKKLRAVLDQGMSPILCVGETAEQRDHEVTLEFVALEVKSALYGISAQELKRIVIAYEPIWAIGTGRAATPQEAGAACREVRDVLRRHYGDTCADGASILYGGSLTPENAFELFDQPDIDGGLIGGASLVPEKFAAIYRAACESR